MEKMVKDKKFDIDLKHAETLNKILKIIKRLIILILLIAIIYFTRNALIIYSIMNKYDNFSNSKNNYHLQVSSRTGDIITASETYFKDGISVSTFFSSNENNLEKRYIQYYNRNTGDITTFDNNNYYGKIKYTNKDTDNVVIFSSMYEQIEFIASPSLFLETMPDTTIFDYISYFARKCIFSKIESAKLQGIDCYKITENSPSYIGTTYYINKKHGTLLRLYDGVDLNYYYEFDTVTDDNVKLPELEEYISHEFEN